MMARVSRSYGAQASILRIKANKNVNEGESSMVGRKYDQNKMPLGRAVLAYFHKALLKVAEVSKKGAEKYGVTFEEQNWRQVEDGHLRYMDAAARHIAARLGGEVYDPESGLPHLAHAAWDCLAALELDIESSEQSDNIASEEEAFIDGRSTKQLSECYDYIASWNDGYPSDPVRFIGR